MATIGRRIGAVCAVVLSVSAATFAARVHAQGEPGPPATPPPPPASDSAASGAEASNEAELAKKLNNPVAALISVPLQSNVDDQIGPDRQGQKYTLNVQPVIPIQLTDSWNVISRTIMPVVSQRDIGARRLAASPASATLCMSLFLSSCRRLVCFLIWGVGPAVPIPLTGDRRAAVNRPKGASVISTAVALTQSKGWTVGALVNQLWSFAGNSSRPEYNKFYLQPFLNYTTKTATTVGLSAEGTYDWIARGMSMPLIGTLSQVGKVNGQLFSLGVAVKYYVATVPNGPHGVGGRVTLTLLFPRR